jgi:hypothetical protein
MGRRRQSLPVCAWQSASRVPDNVDEYDIASQTFSGTDITRAGHTVTVPGLRQADTGNSGSFIPDAFATVRLIDTDDNEIGYSCKLPAHSAFLHKQNAGAPSRVVHAVVRGAGG